MSCLNDVFTLCSLWYAWSRGGCMTAWGSQRLVPYKTFGQHPKWPRLCATWRQLALSATAEIANTETFTYYKRSPGLVACCLWHLDDTPQARTEPKPAGHAAAFPSPPAQVGFHRFPQDLHWFQLPEGAPHTVMSNAWQWPNPHEQLWVPRAPTPSPQPPASPHPAREPVSLPVTPSFPYGARDCDPGPD